MNQIQCDTLQVSGNFVAIKCLCKKEIVRLRQVENIFAEKEVLTFMNHPCIVRCGGAFQDASTLYLVTELCQGGDLFTLICRQPDRRLEDGQAKFYAAGVAMALAYLHARDLVYRALNSENVVIDAKGYIKIVDFQQIAGVVRRPNRGRNEFSKKRLKSEDNWTVGLHPGPELVHKTQKEPLNTVVFEHLRRRFVPHYFAPEVINLGRHGKETDWWCLGILVYEMITGYPPFYDSDPPGLFDKILRKEIDFPVFVMPLTRNFLVKTLCKDRKRRLGEPCLGFSQIANDRESNLTSPNEKVSPEHHTDIVRGALSNHVRRDITCMTCPQSNDEY
jgi:protein kinase A